MNFCGCFRNQILLFMYSDRIGSTSRKPHITDPYVSTPSAVHQSYGLQDFKAAASKELELKESEIYVLTV